MLIIFDLDDTLIDTTGSIVPFKMKLCLQYLLQKGLAIGPLEKAFLDLMALNAASLRSLDAIKKFLVDRKEDPSWAKELGSLLTSPLPDDFVIPTTPGAKEILIELRKKHHLALVTGGKSSFQREKLKKAGIEPSFFSNILIPEDCVKRPSYEALYKEFFDSQVIVCGDRVSMDLAPAYELGFTTVHMRWGRGLVSQEEPWIDYSISDLYELRNIIR